MNRRNLFEAMLAYLLTFAAGWTWGRPKPEQPVKNRLPWASISDAKFAADPTNCYADFEAFEEWLDAWTDRHTGPDDGPGTRCLVEFIDQMGTIDKVGLYSLLIEAIEGPRKPLPECRSLTF